MGPLATIFRTIALCWRYRTVLFSTAWVELRKRYAGTLLGMIWIFLYPALFLAMYLYLYAVVMKVHLPNTSPITYAVFVFSGVVPYLALADAAGAATSVIRQNIFMIKNVMMPVELVPVRVALTALMAQLPGIIILAIFLAVLGQVSILAVALPALLIVEFVFFCGLSWLLAAAGAFVPDLQSAINLILIFLLFVSPIGYMPNMVPSQLHWVLALNPLAYLIELVRSVMIANYPAPWPNLLGFSALALVLFVVGALFFISSKGAVVDAE